MIKRNDTIFYRTKNKTQETGLNASKKVVHKAGEFLGNKKADAVTKSNYTSIEKQELVKEIIIPPEKRREILNKLRKVL